MPLPSCERTRSPSRRRCFCWTNIEFYCDRSRSLRTLVGAAVASERREVGELRDLFVAADGSVASLLVAQGGTLREVEPAGARIELAPAA
jgi:hypothetical protein